MSQQQAEYIRVAIEGELRTRSPLHIGSGEEEIQTLDRADGEEPETTRFNALLKDGDGKPYIPGSTLRGLLRARSGDHPHLAEILFGEARKKVDENRQINWPGHAGQLRVFDARLAGAGVEVERITRTSIDPVTGAARQHHLATHEVVPPGACFRLRLELDHVGEWEVQFVLGLLSSLGDDPDGQLGKSKSTGQGWIEWMPEEVSAIRCDDFLAFLRKEPPRPEARRRHRQAPSSIPTAGKMNALWKPLLLKPGIPRRREWLTIEFSLTPEGPVLVNDPHRVTAVKGDGKPKLVYHRRANGQAEIPGSTLKGWARGWCRRILLTLQPELEDARVDELLAELFGSTDHGMGAVRFESALAENNATHEQTFNAVDRFTGGVKSSALFSVEACWPARFSGCVHLREAKLPDWGRLLLLYLLRDAEEGDLVVGWGKAKGYGRLKLAQQAIDWKSWAMEKPEKLEAWDRALRKQLEPQKEEAQ